MNKGNIYKKISEAKLDEAVGIKHAAVVEGEDLGYHVAEISKQVGAHVHKFGDEIYHVLEGTGSMHAGRTDFDGDKPVKVNWEEPFDVGPGDVFNIPGGYAHSLKNTGDKPLLIAFICPHTHLTTDRYIINS
jgi:mannose-6-phosphate isomerase-like protein (cupin superfamily)